MSAQETRRTRYMQIKVAITNTIDPNILDALGMNDTVALTVESDGTGWRAERTDVASHWPMTAHGYSQTDAILEYLRRRIPDRCFTAFETDPPDEGAAINPAWLAAVERATDALAVEYTRRMKAIITRVCDENGWDFDNTTLAVMTTVRGNRAQEIAGSELPELVFQYRDYFGHDISDFYYRDGVWTGL